MIQRPIARNGAPTVMVSSTFYDLRQVRADLGEFLNNLGYAALLSEHDSFPIDPDVDTVENCRRRVEADADVLVLVVGGRYGSVDNRTSKSVTNIEFDAARVKGIPIYAFVDKSVSALVPVWKANPNANFSMAVDDVKVLNFLDQIMNQHRIWTREFETAQEIVGALRTQFAYLTQTAIKWTSRLRSDKLTTLLQTLSGKALRIALDRPDHWEYYLFAEVLSDEVDKAADLKRQLDLGVLYGVGELVRISNFADWSQVRIAEFQRLNSGGATLVNEAFQKAIGAPGEPGDVEALVYVARDLARIYREAIEWNLRVQRASGDEILQGVLREMSGFSADLIDKLGEWGNVITQVLDQIGLQPEGQRPKAVDVSITLTLPNQEAYQREFDALVEHLQG